nr:hypothetical protein [Tanacetum cinerariifolium]
MLVEQQATDDTTNIAADDVDDVVVEDVDEPTQPLPTPATTPPPPQDLPFTSQEVREEEKVKSFWVEKIKKGGIIADLDADKDVTLEEVGVENKVEVEKNAEIEKNADVQGSPEESQAKVYHIDLEHADKVLSMQDDVKEPAELQEVDDVIEQVKEKGKQDNAVFRCQSFKRKPQIEAQDRNNVMVYRKNMAGFKIYYFKGMSYDDIRPIFEKYFNSNVAFLDKSKEQLEEEESRALKRQSKSSEEKAAKKQKLDEEVEELKKHLQIVLNDDDDVYTKATPLSLKVPG